MATILHTSVEQIYGVPWHRFGRGDGIHALRFELGRGDLALVRVISAHRRAVTICGFLFQNEETLALSIRCWSDANDPVSEGIEALRIPMKTIGLPAPDPTMACVASSDPTVTPKLHEIAALVEIPREAAHRALWSSCAQDFIDVGPCTRGASLRLLSIERPACASVSDDRSMDVVTPSVAVIRSLYHRFYGWVLDDPHSQTHESV